MSVTFLIKIKEIKKLEYCGRSSLFVTLILLTKIDIGQFALF
ncbi:hypothetical protein LLCRE1631_00269 [Lactococcus lactis subsp. lactis CNCM I-1631]|nr:hypothetical protein LLCRE1631_00269 [Lactococcus lactis subsp. lactis CNCM I-1631]